VESAGIDANIPLKKNGKTALHLAADRCHFETVKYLLSLKGCNPNALGK
jgi:ankyrin repeat protein